MFRFHRALRARALFIPVGVAAASVAAADDPSAAPSTVQRLDRPSATGARMRDDCDPHRTAAGDIDHLDHQDDRACRPFPQRDHLAQLGYDL
jgi:hypothetical protein